MKKYTGTAIGTVSDFYKQEINDTRVTVRDIKHESWKHMSDFQNGHDIVNGTREVISRKRRKPSRSAKSICCKTR